MLQKPFVSAMIVPTGVGASIGGFAGDATPAMNLFASVSDVLITHPNVANAAVLQNLPANALYVEGYALDAFFRGEWALQPVAKNKIGVVFDAGIQKDMLTLHRNVVNAVKTVHALDVAGEVVTSEPVQVSCGYTPSGASTGSLKNPQAILDACQKLIDQGATAIALCVAMPALEDKAYQFEGAVDPVGGVEAILSHLVVSEFEIPCAHAPVFKKSDAMPEEHCIVDERVAAECIAPTFLPCVLTGLQRAPQIADANEKHAIAVEDLSALVVPGNALGGIPVLSALEKNIPVIAVSENKTVLNVDAVALSKILPAHCLEQLLVVRSIAEACGVLQMLRCGQPVPSEFRATGISSADYTSKSPLSLS